VCDETLEYVVDGDVAGRGDEHFPVEDVDRLMYEFGQGGRLPRSRRSMNQRYLPIPVQRKPNRVQLATIQTGMKRLHVLPVPTTSFLAAHTPVRTVVFPIEKRAYDAPRRIVIDPELVQRIERPVEFAVHLR